VHKRLAAMIRLGLHASRKQEQIRRDTPPGELRNNDIYRKHHAYNCHRTALEIQGEALDGFDAAHGYKIKIEEKISDSRNQVLDINEVHTKVVKEKAYPRFLHFFEDREERPLHSTLILGPDERGTILCFQKDGFYEKHFKIVRLVDVLNDYNPKNTAACIEPAEEKFKVS
jgi:hypothetical protein